MNKEGILEPRRPMLPPLEFDIEMDDDGFPGKLGRGNCVPHAANEQAILSVVLLPTAGEAGGGGSGCSSSMDPAVADGIKAEENKADGEVVGGGELQGGVAAGWPAGGGSGQRSAPLPAPSEVATRQHGAAAPNEVKRKGDFALSIEKGERKRDKNKCGACVLGDNIDRATMYSSCAFPQRKRNRLCSA